MPTMRWPSATVGGARYGVATMCIGVGQGLACVIENPSA